MFVHERLKWTLYDQSPTTSDTEWLCVDVDGYKIVNIYKLPPTRLQVSDLPVFTHVCLYASDFNCPHVDWGYNTNSLDGDCLLAWASSNNLALLHNPKNEPSFHSRRWNTGTNPDLAFTTVGPDSRLPYRRVLEKYPRSQHRPLLITPPRQGICHHLIQQMWIRPTRAFAIPSAKQPRKLSHAVVVTPTYRVGTLSVRPSTKRFCSLLLETSQAGLLQP